MAKILCIITLVLVSLAPPSVAQGSPPEAPNVLPRVIVVISDLHLGPGERAIGEYFPQEDFQWGEDFVTFLDALHRAGDGKVTLVIAGDMFELWESMEGDCRADAPQFGCSEEEARQRMIRIVSAHRLELQALGAFASRGTNQVVIIPGNHDAAILFPSVWNLVKSAARPLRPNHLILAANGRWISPSGNVVVEHGHQLDKANMFDDWPNPMAQASPDVLRIRSPFGERLVREFFDPLEQRYPTVDNITEGGGVLYGVKREGLVGTARVFTDFLKLLSLDTSWRQREDALGDGARPPVWNVEKTRAAGLNLLEFGFPLEDATTPLVREILASNDSSLATAATLTAADMTEDEIRIICQSRYLTYLRLENEGVPKEQRPALCEQVDGDLGYASQKAVQRIRGSMVYVNRHIDNVIKKLPEVTVRAPDAPVTFVYGHTHAATRAQYYQNRFTIINTGAWQRIVSAETVAAKATSNGWAAEQVLERLKLGELPACYSFVWIPFQLGKTAVPKLRYWRSEGDFWKFATDCPEREVLPPE